jgi:hypothetical protein
MPHFRLVYRVDRVEGVMNMVLTKVEQILGRLLNHDGSIISGWCIR